MVSTLFISQDVLRKDDSHTGLVTIKKADNIFESQAVSLGVFEPDAEDHADQDSKADEVVLPLDGSRT
jgi:hypothetical protein